jgi:hypothetical protein
MEDSVMGIGEVAAFSELVQSNGNGYAPARGVGRPSTVAQYTPQISQWLRENPIMSGAEVLRRVRSTGYRGGKSALYELVRRLRLAPSGN